MGGAQVITMGFGFARAKLAAVLLGPTGVGLIGLYQNLIAMLSMVAGHGVSSSGVRAIAEATANSDSAQVGRMVRVINRLSWALGGLGWVVTACLAYPLSNWLFNDPGYSLSVALAGGAVMLTVICSGQATVLQGTRRIGDLARLNIGSAVAGTLVSLGCYAAWGKAGIVPALVLSSLITLGWSWWYTRNLEINITGIITWSHTFRAAKPLLSLGLAFAWSGVITTGAGLVIRALITKELGLEATGLYQAAWSISGLFAGFVLGAMGTDFYPRLTTVANDHVAVNKLVNEQTEVGILLALPGLLGTLVLAPHLITILYSHQFEAAAALLPAFMLGVFGRVLSWPLAFILLAKGESRWYAISETVSNVGHLAIVCGLIQGFKLAGVAYAFSILYFFYLIGMLVFNYRLTGFCWSTKAKNWILVATLLVVGAISIDYIPGNKSRTLCAIIILCVGTLICLYGLVTCLPVNHKLRIFLYRLNLIKK